MKKTVFFCGIFAAGMLCLALLGRAGTAYAQGTEGVKIEPVLIERTVEPGEVFSGTFRATNISSTAKSYYCTTKDVLDLSESGQPIFASPQEKTRYEISSWITLPKDAIPIGPGETKEIPFTITVPASVSPGGHYGGIFLGLQPSELVETGSGVGFQVGLLLNFRTKGEAVEDMQIREFRADRSVYGSANALFTARLENLGNVLLRPTGFVEVANMFGKQVASIRVNESTGAVFPNTIRAFEASWRGALSSIGRHQATLTVMYGQEGKKFLSATLSFWVFPVKIIFPALGGLLVLVAAIWIGVRLYIRRRLREFEVLAAEGRERRALLPQKQTPSSRLFVAAIALLVFVAVFMLALLLIFS